MRTHPLVFRKHIDSLSCAYITDYHFFFDILTMSNYVPVKKIIKIVSAQRNPRHERRSSLQECYESAGARRRSRCNPWIVLFFLLSTVIYLYCRRADYMPPLNGRIFNTKIRDDANLLYEKNKLSIDVTPMKKPAVPPLAKPNTANTVKTTANTQMKTSGDFYKSSILKSESDLKPRQHPAVRDLPRCFRKKPYRTELFNKGRVLNAGFNEMMKFNTFHCVVFHDLDLLPMHESILYNCPTLPRHMCARVNDTQMNKFDQTYKFRNLFGGVVSMTRDQFERANGFSNLYFGWGGEDNDLFYRLNAAGYPIVRYNSSIGVYLVLPHYREPANPFRHHLLSRAVERYKIDGLSDSEYSVVYTKFRPLCTHIVVNINPRADNITEISHKWSNPLVKFH
ncbi:hypothetical protein PYW07_005016 [Mythimna separata]|uniref:Beta-1,4-N-acetylgalactosaminyltransferase n=1 Tax=Mythimna separata TaxID=271217 RepID=A0AAD7YDK4_MYTSE|nr:hypothetical protein PYW07_005016 [Mythimna separata]